MRFFFAAFLFCLAVAVFTFVAKVVYQGSVETELRAKAEAALEEAGFDEVTVDFDHHDAVLSGTVDGEEQKQEVLSVLREAVPIAFLPEADKLTLTARPTIPSEVRIEKKAGSTSVSLVGVLSALGEANRQLIGARLHELPQIDSIENQIELDPRRIPLLRAAELASLAASLIEHSDAALVELSGNSLTIVGKVPNDGLKAGLLELAEKLETENVSEEVTVQSLATFLESGELTITRNRFGVTVTGVLGSESDKSTIIEAFSVLDPAPQVTESVEIREGVAPLGWIEAAPAMLQSLLGDLQGEFTAEFSRRQARLSGRVAGEEEKRHLLDALALLGQGGKGPEILADLTIATAEEGNPARLFATYEGGLLELTGLLPDTGFVAELETSLAESHPEVVIRNSIEEIDSAADAKWVGHLLEFFEEIPGRIEKGSFTFSEDALKLEGTVVALSDLQILQNVAVNTAAQELSIDNQLQHPAQSFPEPELLPEQREKLVESFQQFPVYFDSGSEVVSSKERPKLEALAKLLTEAEAAEEIRVTGYADNIGNDEFNRKLGMSRAASVVAVLESLGIKKDRLAVSSEIEDVSSVRRSDRWKSRRVELSLPESDSDTADKEGQGTG